MSCVEFFNCHRPNAWSRSVDISDNLYKFDPIHEKVLEAIAWEE